MRGENGIILGFSQVKTAFAAELVQIYSSILKNKNENPP